MHKSFVHFMNDNSGSQAMEYAMIAALVSVGILGATQNIGSTISTLFIGPLIQAFQPAP